MLLGPAPTVKRRAASNDLSFWSSLRNTMRSGSAGAPSPMGLQVMLIFSPWSSLPMLSPSCLRHGRAKRRMMSLCWLRSTSVMISCRSTRRGGIRVLGPATHPSTTSCAPHSPRRSLLLRLTCASRVVDPSEANPVGSLLDHEGRGGVRERLAVFFANVNYEGSVLTFGLQTFLRQDW